MRNPLHFFRDLVAQPRWIPAWVGFIMAVNMAAVAFGEHALAKAIVLVFLLSAWLMMGLYARFGFEKILGLGHVGWVPLLGWVIVALPAATGVFKVYLLGWAITTVVSLVFDAIDVWTYFSRGRREALPSPP